MTLVINAGDIVSEVNQYKVVEVTTLGKVAQRAIIDSSLLKNYIKFKDAIDNSPRNRRFAWNEDITEVGKFVGAFSMDPQNFNREVMLLEKVSSEIKLKNKE